MFSFGRIGRNPLGIGSKPSPSSFSSSLFVDVGDTPLLKSLVGVGKSAGRSTPYGAGSLPISSLKISTLLLNAPTLGSALPIASLTSTITLLKMFDSNVARLNSST